MAYSDSKPLIRFFTTLIHNFFYSYYSPLSPKQKKYIFKLSSNKFLFIYLKCIIRTALSLLMFSLKINSY